ncbi:MAG: DUF805 domain-containing protein [Pseudomonadota bacterium]
MTDAANAVPAGRMVSFGQALPLFFKNYFQFNGRSSRGAYWWATLALVLISIAAAVVDIVLFNDFVEAANGNGPVGILLSLATLIPGIAIGVRRLHDVGRSGWWTLLVFTIIGILVLLFWYIQPGQRKDNPFGADVEAGR